MKECWINVYRDIYGRHHHGMAHRERVLAVLCTRLGQARALYRIRVKMK